MKKIIALLIIVFSHSILTAQIDIAINSFEEAASDTWVPITLSTPACTNGSDQWDYDTSLDDITPSDGSQFWGIRDLDGNCGGGDYETIIFPSIDITNYTGVTISFDYYTIGYEGTDNLGYEIWEDGTKVVDLVNLDDDSNAWLTITYNVSVGVSDVYLVLKAKQNGGNDYAGFDNVKLRGTVASTDTSVEFVTSNYTQTEDGVSIDLCVAITNESATAATTVDVVLTSSNTPHLTSYSTQTLTFPAGSTAQQCVTVNVTNNGNCDGDTPYDFNLQNINGGEAASIGTQNTTQLNISDDENQTGEYLFAKFEGADTWGYTANGSIENDFNRYNDTNSYRLSGTSGRTIEFDDVNITGFTDVSISVAYAATDVDSNDDLFMEISFDGGANYDESIKLVDGSSNFDLNINTTNNINRTPQGINPYSYAVPSGQTSVRVRFRSLNISSSEYYYIDDVIITRTACTVCEEPTTDAVFHLNSPQNLTTSTATLNWTNGDGQNRIVVMKEASAVSFSPTDGSSYTANASFGSGTDVGSGEYVVYNGSLNSVAITNLNPGTEYFVKIYEYGCNAGNEDYYTTGTPTEDHFITPTENPNTFTKGCVNNTTIDLNWTPPASGNFDGYLLVVREANTPHSVNGLDPSTALGENLDYTLAATFGATSPNSRILYKGTNTAATVTGLTQGTSYTFKIYTYAIGTTDYVYGTGKSTTQNISLSDVSLAYAGHGDSLLTANWTNPDASCFDEILVVANETAGIDFTPTGDGSSYTANTVYAGVNSIVYKGTGNTETITNLTNNTTYYFEIFVRKGTSWSSGIEISNTPSSFTILEKGDLAIIAINTQYLSSGSDDETCFFAFQDITTGTAIDFTDNGYERVNQGLWGETEGVIRIERTGGTITKGTVICIQGAGHLEDDFTIKICGVDDTANWTISSLNGIYNFDLNGEDQIWILQNGNWSNPSGSHNADYSGNILYGWTAVGWEPAINYNDSKGSTLPNSMSCFSTNLTGITTPDKGKYNGDPSIARTQKEWIIELNNADNWVGYADNTAYNSGTNDYQGSCITFNILGTGYTTGQWTGAEDNNWFNCANWDDLLVPNETVNVLLGANATQEVVINDTATDADLHNGIAKCNDLTISTQKIVLESDINDKLEIHGNLLINGGELDMDDDDNNTADGQVYLYGNWTNNANANFIEGNGTLHFVGTTPQTIICNTGTETEYFYNLVLDNNFTTDDFNSDIHAKGSVTLKDGRSLEVKENHYLQAGINLTVAAGATLDIEDKASLIQIDDNGTVTNNGTTNVYKTTTPYVAYDYTYWSSPIQQETIGSVFATNPPNWIFRLETPNFQDVMQGSGFPQPNVGADGFDDNGDDWQPMDAANVLSPGVGYITMGETAGTYPHQQSIVFSASGSNGALNNGIINTSVFLDYYHTNATGGYDSFNTNANLIGNPYPSAIDINKFYTDNSARLEGTFYFWTHDTPINTIPGPDTYNFTNDDYATATSDGTVLSYVQTSPEGTNVPNFIASGQGFLVNIDNAGDVTFNNAMRVTGNNTFMRTTETDIDRLWLNLTREDMGVFRQILIGFYDNATDTYQGGQDGQRLENGNNTDFYSIIPNEERRFAIQNLASFNTNKTIDLGLEIIEAGSYSIAIDHFEGIFEENQNIYLQDNYLDLIHNLSDANYEFSANIGANISDRFVVRFTDGTTGLATHLLARVRVFPNPSTAQFTILWKGLHKPQIQVFDLSGKLILNHKNGDNSNQNYTLDMKNVEKGVYFLVLTSDEGSITKKIVLQN